MIFTEAERNLALDLFARIRNASVEPGGGVTRPSYGVAETDAMLMIAEVAGQLQLHTANDDVANLIITVDAKRPEKATWLGSHLDSVPHGGNYDGLAGVIAALLVLSKAKQQGITRPLVGLGLRGEESSWFGVPHVGAKALLGKLPAEDLARSRGSAVYTLEAAMNNVGARVMEVKKNIAFESSDSIDAWWELHIEQGPVLQAMNVPIGVVTDVRGSIRALNARVTGKAGHSGTTPHDMREDAVLRFADLISALEQRRAGFSDLGKDLVLTCGIVHTNTLRNGITSIADEVTFTLDVRSTNLGVIYDLYNFAEMYGGGYLELGELVVTKPCTLAPALIGKTTQAAIDLGIKHIAMPSGAGHDSTVFQDAGIPSGMIFVRNQHGSHNPHEAMDIDDFMLGVETLYRVVTC